MSAPTTARLLETARTTDLYDVIAAALNELAKREAPAAEEPLDARVRAQYAEICRGDDGQFDAIYYAVECAEEADQERGATT
ncbi:hypothetical protein [Actinomadura sp. NPDC049753]|uniref:hypothetical protein n=1 Tax=Actinomadura sp. NPDC049753 TaxID=3154739 RepID=UPI003428604A